LRVLSTNFTIMSAAPAVANGDDSADRNVEMWKIKKLIKSLEMARGLVFASFYLNKAARNHINAKNALYGPKICQ
jgi:hypothetical protein